MKCGNCGTENRNYHRFCYFCGARLSKDFEGENNTEAEEEKATENTSEFQNEDEIPSDQREENSDLSDLEDIHDENEMTTDSTEPVDESEDDSMKSYESIYDYLFSQKKDDFNIEQELPLKRYKKDHPPRRTPRFVGVLISIILIAGMALLIYHSRDFFTDLLKPSVQTNLEITADVLVEEIIRDMKPAHRFIINTNGTKIDVLGEILYTEDGKAEIIFDDSVLCTYLGVNDHKPEETQIRMTISKDGYRDYVKVVSFTLAKPLAPLEVKQPVSNETVCEDESFDFILNILPGSSLYINDNNYTDIVDPNGYFQRRMDLPDQPETRFTVRVVTAGYQDRIEEFVFRRPEKEIPLVINESLPIKTSDDWTVVTGITSPEAQLTVDGDIKEPPKIDPETGEFIITVKSTNPGLTPYIIRAQIEGKRDSIVEIVVDRKDATYDRTAWKLDYDNLKRYPDIHQGQHYSFTGIVKDILFTGDKKIFTVDVSTTGETEQLVYIEYWGMLDLEIGKKLRIFGDRWGNKNDMPRILARDIYS